MSRRRRPSRYQRPSAFTTRRSNYEPPTAPEEEGPPTPLHIREAEARREWERLYPDVPYDDVYP